MNKWVKWLVALALTCAVAVGGLWAAGMLPGTERGLATLRVQQARAALVEQAGVDTRLLQEVRVERVTTDAFGAERAVDMVEFAPAIASLTYVVYFDAQTGDLLRADELSGEGAACITTTVLNGEDISHLTKRP